MSVSEEFLTQVVGRLYLENAQLHALLKTLPDKDQQIAGLKDELNALKNATGAPVGGPTAEANPPS